MQLTSAQIKALGEQLVALAAIFSPANAVAIKALIVAGTELNDLIHEIKNQTEENAPDVWAAVTADYTDALDAFQASVDRHM